MPSKNYKTRHPYWDRPFTPLDVRFWRYVDKSADNGCWLWTGGKKVTGMGNFQVK